MHPQGNPTSAQSWRDRAPSTATSDSSLESLDAQVTSYISPRYLSNQPMNDDEKFLSMMRALSDPNRLSILRILKGRRLCSCQILKGMAISQPTLSHHMSILLDAGLVRTIPTGRWYDYEVDEEALRFLESYIGTIL